jgi:hypothetical protein
MTCEELREGLELYALGLLEEPERTELQGHLQRGCEVCVAALRRALAVNAALARTAPVANPSARLGRRVAASVALAKRTSWTWFPAWAAVTGLLLGLCLWLGLRDRRYAANLADARAELSQVRAEAGRTAVQLARVQSALEFLHAPETRVVVTGRGGVLLPPRARVFLNPDRGVLLMADNLPPAPAGKIYEMWVIPKKGAPQPAGLFHPGLTAGQCICSPGVWTWLLLGQWRSRWSRKRDRRLLLRRPC